jgi:hypothetical protein
LVEKYTKKYSLYNVCCLELMPFRDLPFCKYIVLQYSMLYIYVVDHGDGYFSLSTPLDE